MKETLIEYMQNLAIIDCHEHLMPECERVNTDMADVLLLFSLYTYGASRSAGMPEEYFKGKGQHYNFFADSKRSLEERWQVAWPYLQRLKFTSAFRAPIIALRDIYGIDELDDSAYKEASERIRAANKPGLYMDVLRKRCKIKKCLVVNPKTRDNPDPPDLFSPLYGVAEVLLVDSSLVQKLGATYDTTISDLDTYLEVVRTHLRKMKDERGAIGLKGVSYELPEPDMAAARKEFAAALEDGGQPSLLLASTILDFVFERAAEWDWPVAVHTGNTGDYRKVDPKHMIRVVERHPNVRFDLFHLGVPFVRDCIWIAKNFPNAYLNLCWCYLLSQEITRRTINEILDVVPVNKVFGFGGDYVWAVENVYGHLVMARETLAEALSERIARGQLDVAGAKQIARLWLHDNPCAFYGID